MGLLIGLPSSQPAAGVWELSKASSFLRSFPILPDLALHTHRCLCTPALSFRAVLLRRTFHDSGKVL